jgi:hypothetical protein
METKTNVILENQEDIFVINLIEEDSASADMLCNSLACA